MEKPKPDAQTTGSTPWERFVSLARKVTRTPKAEVEKREREWREERQSKKQRP